MIKDNRDNKNKSWCEWVRYTEAYPHEKVENMTIQEFINLEKHVNKCKKYYIIIAKILRKNPTQRSSLFLTN